MNSTDTRSEAGPAVIVRARRDRLGARAVVELNRTAKSTSGERVTAQVAEWAMHRTWANLSRMM